MIEEFSFQRGDIYFPLSLGYRRSIFENIDDELANKYVNTALELLVSWKFKDKTIQIKRSTFTYPSVDMDYVIAIFPLEDKEFSSPHNAVIYNADGSLHKVLTPPKLISQLAINRLGKDNPPQPYAPDSIYFERVRWDKNSQGELVTSVWIGYDREWHENRMLDPETGEFGECIGSGKL